MIDIHRIIILAVAAAITPATLAQSQVEGDTPASQSDFTTEPAPEITDTANPWRAELTAWIWAVGMDGTVGARGRRADMNESFIDILDKSDSIFAFSGRLEVGYDRWAAFADGMYCNLGADNQSGPMDLANVDVTIEQVVLDFGAMYRVARWEPDGTAASNRLDITLDLYGGGRYNHVDLELAPANLDSRSRDKGWVDPIFGAKLILPLSKDWHLRLNGDVGGFGVSSDFTWSATGVFGYDFELLSMPATVYAGYRAIGWDYSDGSGDDEFVWDITMHGPIIGFSLSF